MGNFRLMLGGEMDIYWHLSHSTFLCFIENVACFCKNSVSYECCSRQPSCPHVAMILHAQ